MSGSYGDGVFVIIFLHNMNNRMKSRVTASKERIVELEKQVKTLEANATKRKALEDKTEAMKLALARKDAILKNHKEQLEAVRVELLAMQEVTASRQADGDKHLRYVLCCMMWLCCAVSSCALRCCSVELSW